MMVKCQRNKMAHSVRKVNKVFYLFYLSLGNFFVSFLCRFTILSVFHITSVLFGLSLPDGIYSNQPCESTVVLSICLSFSLHVSYRLLIDGPWIYPDGYINNPCPSMDPFIRWSVVCFLRDRDH